MENTNTNNNTFGFRKSKRSIVPIILSSLLAGGALAGSAVGIWHISQNYTESPEFTTTVNGRMKIDPFAQYDGDKDIDNAQKIAKECAKKLSRWLKDKGQKNYDVSYEAYELKTNEFECYLNAQFEVDKVFNKNPTSIEEKEKKIDNDPYLSFFASDAFNSNEKSFVYRWYIDQPELSETNRPIYTVVPFRDIFALPKEVDADDSNARTLVSEDGENGVVFEVQENTILSDIYADLVKAKKADEDKPDPENKIPNEWQKPRLYIVNNLEGLINEANYHLAYGNGYKNTDEYLRWYSESQYASFSEKYTTKDVNGEELTQSKKQEHYVLNSVKDKDGNVIAGLDVFNYLDQSNAGTNEIGFASKYIDKIVTFGDFNKVMPEKITDLYKNDIDDENPNIKCFWYPTGSKATAEAYLNNQIKYGFNEASIKKLTFDDVQGTGETGSENVIKQIKKEDIIAQSIAPTFTQTIFGGSNLVGMLSLGFLIFLIALLVILACLYRTTGVFSWICMVFALSMTGLIATIGSTAISMSLLFGLFAVSLVGFMASLAICGRLKRRLQSQEDTQVIINKAFKKSLLPVADMSVVMLIFGICFTYIAPISLNALGLALIAGAFMTFISVYLINGLLHLLFFNNGIMVNKYQFFGKPSNVANQALSSGNNAIPSSLDATRLEIPYYSSMSKKPIDATNKKALIAICVVAGLLVIGIIIFSVLGFTSPRLFHTTRCVAIQYDGNILTQYWFKNVGLDYTSYTYSHGWWFFYTNLSSAEAERIARAIAMGHEGLTYGVNVQCQSIIGTTNKDILNLALISIIVATLLSAIYSGIRNNWIAIVPMIAGSFGIPLLILGLSSIFQVKFDQFVVLTFAMVSIVNTIFALNIAGSINESWSRKEAFTNEEFKFIANVSLKNNWTYIWNVAAAYGAFILIYGLTAPAGPSTLSTIGLLIVSCVITVVVTPLVVTFLLYQFMKVRNFALGRRLQKSQKKVVINYDDIDEQGIEGINKFTKKIPVRKPTQESKHE